MPFSEILQSIAQTFFAVWWVVIPLALFFIFRDLWLLYIQTQYVKAISWMLLEVKIPKNILTTPKAMEQIFAAAHGTYSHGIRFFEKWWDGKVEDWMSFELVGYAGGVYFYIRLPSKYRNLIEAAIYAQYPNAEINAAPNDYLELLPASLPNEVYDLSGMDIVLAREDAYPIRTYPYFEAIVEEQRLDPIAAVTEVMSKLKEGEMILIQILVRPVGEAWKKKAEELIAKLIGTKSSKQFGLMSWISVFLRNLIFAIFVYPLWPDEAAKSEGPPNMLSSLTKGQKDVVEAIEEKIAKIGFETGIRFIYIDRRDSFTRANVAAVNGAFRQFDTQNLNRFRPDLHTLTKVHQPFKARRERSRKKMIFVNYRTFTMSKKVSILNIEELATIYHPPIVTVAAPMLQRLESRKGGPPPTLPIE
ncbi:MAG: hypothetical protein Q8Q41_01580 [bacterium]|nr:hypothetical protein [bacterium]